MSEVKKGDRVRVTSVVEGLVTYADKDGYFEVDGPHYYSAKTSTEVERKVEVLKRKVEPLKSGTVVTRSNGVYLVGENRVSFTAYGGEIIEAGTPLRLAQRIAAQPDEFKIFHPKENA